MAIYNAITRPILTYIAVLTPHYSSSFFFKKTKYFLNGKDINIKKHFSTSSVVYVQTFSSMELPARSARNFTATPATLMAKTNWAGRPSAVLAIIIRAAKIRPELAVSFQFTAFLINFLLKNYYF